MFNIGGGNPQHAVSGANTVANMFGMGFNPFSGGGLGVLGTAPMAGLFGIPLLGAGVMMGKQHPKGILQDIPQGRVVYNPGFGMEGSGRNRSVAHITEGFERPTLARSRQQTAALRGLGVNPMAVKRSINKTRKGLGIQSQHTLSPHEYQRGLEQRFGGQAHGIMGALGMPVMSRRDLRAAEEQLRTPMGPDGVSRLQRLQGNAATGNMAVPFRGRGALSR